MAAITDACKTSVMQSQLAIQLARSQEQLFVTATTAVPCKPSLPFSLTGKIPWSAQHVGPCPPTLNTILPSNMADITMAIATVMLTQGPWALLDNQLVQMDCMSCKKCTWKKVIPSPFFPKKVYRQGQILKNGPTWKKMDHSIWKLLYAFGRARRLGGMPGSTGLGARRTKRARELGLGGQAEAGGQDQGQGQTRCGYYETRNYC